MVIGKKRYRVVFKLPSFFLWLLLLCPCINSWGQVVNEYQVKAVFLYNFTHFVNWPESAFAEANSPFIIGVFGENVFGGALEETVRGEAINGHPILVKYVTTVAQLEGCHILFIEGKAMETFSEIYDFLKTKPVLTVSDAPSFMARSGMLRLYKESQKVKLEINLEETRRSGLEVSAKLLNLARHYRR